MKISKLFSKLYDTVEEEPEELKLIKELLLQIQVATDEIEDDEMRSYVQEFVDSWLVEGYLEGDFDVFSSELNELIVELGNEGYFDEMG